MTESVTTFVTKQRLNILMIHDRFTDVGFVLSAYSTQKIEIRLVRIRKISPTKTSTTRIDGNTREHTKIDYWIIGVHKRSLRIRLVPLDRRLPGCARARSLVVVRYDGSGAWRRGNEMNDVFHDEIAYRTVLYVDRLLAKNG